jgi:hypothetical protein
VDTMAEERSISESNSKGKKKLFLGLSIAIVIVLAITIGALVAYNSFKCRSSAEKVVCNFFEALNERNTKKLLEQTTAPEGFLKFLPQTLPEMAEDLIKELPKGSKVQYKILSTEVNDEDAIIKIKTSGWEWASKFNTVYMIKDSKNDSWKIDLVQTFSNNINPFFDGSKGN